MRLHAGREPRDLWLEARLDARFQEVTARLVLHDGRFAAMSDRLIQADRRADATVALLINALLVGSSFLLTR